MTTVLTPVHLYLCSCSAQKEQSETGGEGCLLLLGAYISACCSPLSNVTRSDWLARSAMIITYSFDICVTKSSLFIPVILDLNTQVGTIAKVHFLCLMDVQQPLFYLQIRTWINLFIYYQFLLKDGLYKRLDSLYKVVPYKNTYIYKYTETQTKPQNFSSKVSSVLVHSLG